MDAQQKKVAGIAAGVVGVAIVGWLVYSRIAPDPYTRSLNDSADKLEKQLQDLKKK